MRMLNALLPRKMRLAIREAKAEARQAREKAARWKDMTAQQIFTEVYRTGLWGKSEEASQPFYSGTGSHDAKITTPYVDSVGRFLQTLPDKPNVVDLGCGDFNIGRQIRPFCNRYVACDIVPQLIDYNRARYAGLDVDFRVVDLVTDPLPTGDVVFIRQVLQHLSNAQIQKVVARLSSSYDFLVLTEHLPKGNLFAANLDKQTDSETRLDGNTGGRSGVVLTKPPFNMTATGERIICESEEYGGVIRTIVYRLK